MKKQSVHPLMNRIYVKRSENQDQKLYFQGQPVRIVGEDVFFEGLLDIKAPVTAKELMAANRELEGTIAYMGPFVKKRSGYDDFKVGDVIRYGRYAVEFVSKINGIEYDNITDDCVLCILREEEN